MRAWPVLLLLSCSRPNPLFLGEAAGTGDDMTQGSASSSIAATVAAATTDPTDSTGTPVPTTSSADATTGRLLCEPFPGVRLGVDPPLPETDCVAVIPFHGKVSKIADTAEVTLCADEECSLCSFSAPLDPELAKYLVDGACLRVVHQGAWLPDDPEAPFSCKTTGLAVYDDASVYPLYVASSRVTHAPGFLDSDVRMDVAQVEAERCDCELADCCPEGQAESVRLAFTDHGAPVGTLGPGGVTTTDLKGATYFVAVRRAHIKGYFGVQDGDCVADPATEFIDWEMLRILGP